MIYKIKIKLTEHKINKVTERVLRKSYKTLRGAEKMAANYRYICKPEGIATEECDSWVVSV